MNNYRKLGLIASHSAIIFGIHRRCGWESTMNIEHGQNNDDDDGCAGVFQFFFPFRHQIQHQFETKNIYISLKMNELLI